MFMIKISNKTYYNIFITRLIIIFCFHFSVLFEFDITVNSIKNN